ncbi:hypothetical protein ABN584_16730 [Gloeocapsa sp. BRSZ]
MGRGLTHKKLVLVYEGTLWLDSPEESRRKSVIHAEGLSNTLS